MKGENTRRDRGVRRLPWLARDAFGILAEGLIGRGARGDGAGRGPHEGRGRSFGDLLAQVADPRLLLVLGAGQPERVAGRRPVAVACWAVGGGDPGVGWREALGGCTGGGGSV